MVRYQRNPVMISLTRAPLSLACPVRATADEPGPGGQ